MMHCGSQTRVATKKKGKQPAKKYSDFRIQRDSIAASLILAATDAPVGHGVVNERRTDEDAKANGRLPKRGAIGGDIVFVKPGQIKTQLHRHGRKIVKVDGVLLRRREEQIEHVKTDDVAHAGDNPRDAAFEQIAREVGKSHVHHNTRQADEQHVLEKAGEGIRDHRKDAHALDAAAAEYVPVKGEQHGKKHHDGVDTENGTKTGGDVGQRSAPCRLFDLKKAVAPVARQNQRSGNNGQERQGEPHNARQAGVLNVLTEDMKFQHVARIGVHNGLPNLKAELGIVHLGRVKNGDKDDQKHRQPKGFGT